MATNTTKLVQRDLSAMSSRQNAPTARPRPGTGRFAHWHRAFSVGSPASLVAISETGGRGGGVADILNGLGDGAAGPGVGTGCARHQGRCGARRHRGLIERRPRAVAAEGAR